MVIRRHATVFQLHRHHTGSYNWNDKHYNDPKAQGTASLMIDETKQSLLFRPSGDVVPADFTKSADDVAHHRSCQDIMRADWERNIKFKIYSYPSMCADISSDDTHFHFNAKDYDGDPQKILSYSRYEWNGNLDRVTGHLEVSLLADNLQISTGPGGISNGDGTFSPRVKSGGSYQWDMICKKVDKLVDKQ